MTDPIALRLDLACRMARKAGEMLVGFRKVAIEVTVKGAQDFVTQADSAVEEMIRAAVAREFPGDHVLGEEGGGSEADRLWVIDPIDGTINFIRGLPSFAVSIAYVERGELEIGVVQAPVHGETFVARRGGGATCNSVPIRVSACASLAQARIAAGYAQRGDHEEHLSVLRALMAGGSDVLKLNSAAICLALVASGRIDGYVERELMSWDVLGGQLLVREAGGWTNQFGRDGLLARDGVIASGKALLPELAAAANWVGVGDAA